MTTETIQQNALATLNRAVNDFNALKMRLDTTDLIDKIKLFISAKHVSIMQDEKTGKIIKQDVKVGIPKANDEGIQAILNWVSSTINPQTVQGNFPSDAQGLSPAYEDYIEEYHIELATLLVNNCYNWEIKDDEINGIVEFIMLLIIPYMSRLIDNKERESYGETVKTIESNITQAKGGLNLLSGG